MALMLRESFKNVKKISRFLISEMRREKKDVKLNFQLAKSVAKSNRSMEKQTEKKDGSCSSSPTFRSIITN